MLQHFQMNDGYISDSENTTGIEWHLFVEPFLSQLITISDWMYITASTNHPARTDGQPMFLSGLVRHEMIPSLSSFLKNHRLSHEWFDYKNQEWIRYFPENAQVLGMILFQYDYDAQKWWLHENITTPEHGLSDAKSFKECIIKSGYDPTDNTTPFPTEFFSHAFFLNRYLLPFDDADDDNADNDIMHLCGSTEYHIRSGELVFMTISNDVDPLDRCLYEKLSEFR